MRTNRADSTLWGVQVVGRNCRFLQAPPGKQRVPTAAMAAIRSALQGGRAKVPPISPLPPSFQTPSDTWNAHRCSLVRWRDFLCQLIMCTPACVP